MPKGPVKHRRDTNANRWKGHEIIFMEDTGRIKKTIQGQRGLLAMII